MKIWETINEDENVTITNTARRINNAIDNAVDYGTRSYVENIVWGGISDIAWNAIWEALRPAVGSVVGVKASNVSWDLVALP